jgi:hypothetical protein
MPGRVKARVFPGIGSTLAVGPRTSLGGGAERDQVKNGRTKTRGVAMPNDVPLSKPLSNGPNAQIVAAVR